MLVANRAAAFARLHAGPQLRARELEIRASETRDDPPCRHANIRAIIAIANALHQLRDVLLAETSIRACVAGLRAGVTRRDAFHIDRVIR